MATPILGTITALLPFKAAEPSGFFEESCSNSLGLFEDVQIPIVREASNSLSFTDEATHNYVFRDVDNSMGFLGESGYDQEVDIVQYLGFTGPRVFDETSNFFGLQNEVRIEIVASAANSLGLAEEVLRAYPIANSLSLDSLAIGFSEADAENSLGLVASVDSSDSVYDRDLTQSFLQQHVTYEISGSRCPEKEYAPQVGSSSDDSYDEMPLAPPTLGTGVLTLSHPFTSPTTTLVLKNPVFQNADQTGYSLVDRVTRGGERIIFGDSKWPTTQILSFNIVNVCNPAFTDLIDFVNATIGQEIRLVDWEARTWRGFILAPNITITENPGGYSVKIEFQGEVQ